MMEKSLICTYEKVNIYIPDDIVFSILSKLSIKSIKRFECVRKSWSLLFQNHHFMNMFRNNLLSSSHLCSYYEGASLLLSVYPETIFYSLSGEMFQNMVKLDWSHLFENPGHDFPHELFGSINGILCFHQHDRFSTIVLWNPATHVSKYLPPSPAIPDEDDDFSLSILHRVHGFGYDDLTNDYKVIRYVSITGEYYDEENILEVQHITHFWEIYSLRSNSWRKLDVDIPNSWSCTQGTKVYMCGVCHWLCNESEDEQGSFAGPCLVSFYLSKEVFVITPLPSEIDNCFGFEESWINLTLLNESIALISYHKDTTFHISILGEFGAEESWTKVLTVGPLPFVELPIGVGTKGEIFFVRNDEELVWLDLSTEMIVELGYTYKVEPYSSQITIYKESILPLEGIRDLISLY